MKQPHSSNLRLHRDNTPAGNCFFVTKCLHPRAKILAGAPATEIVSALCFYARERKFHLAAFVVMPDHWRRLGMVICKREISTASRATLAMAF